MKNNIFKKLISGLLLFSILGYTTPIFALTKEEKVYSKLDNEGKSYNTIVSTHIKNEELLKVINDVSNLVNIKNIGGNEECNFDGNNVIWNSDGRDIYYQGESKQELPVETIIKYELDGKEIEAKELIGKKGKVKITITYKNKDEHIVNINGKDEKIYTPFIAITGVSIDNKNNHNIEIVNGKTIEKDDNTIVVGVTFPGLQNSLDIKSEEINFPDSIEMSMDVEDFELSNILTYITPRVLDDEEKGINNKIKELYSSIEDMKSASCKIENGVNELKNGTSEYVSKSEEFTQYMNKLSNGTLETENGMKQVAGGVTELSSKTKELALGSDKVSSGVNTLKQGINTASNASIKLSDGATNINKGVESLSDGINTLNKELSQIDTKNIESKIEQLNELKLNLEKTNKALDIQIQKNSENVELVTILKQQKMMNEISIESVKNNIISIKSTAKLKQAVGKLKVGIDGTNEQTGLKQGMSSLVKGTKDLSNGLEAMDTKTEELVKGTKTLNKGTQKLVTGVNTIKTGTDKLNSGVSTLNSSTVTLCQASDKLTEGSKSIDDGVNSLSNGITKFNDEAINKIYNYVNDDVKSLVNKVDELNKLSNEYINFAMKDKDANGNVEFILLTDALKKDKKDK